MTTLSPEPPPPPSPELVDKVCLSFPADPRLFLLARMTGAAIATQSEFTVEDIADLRLAIDELCTSCSEGAGKQSAIELSFTWSADAIRVGCAVGALGSAAPAGAADPDLLSQAELSERILASLVDSYEIGPSLNGRRSGFFVKFRDSDPR